ncbi:MAG: DUF6804 family protein [Patescibacteria group bacterium]
MLIVITKLIIAGLSFWALADNPYGYYQFLRIAIFIVGIIFAYKAYANKQEISFWACVYGLSALIWNPIFPIYMSKEVWSIFNVAVGMIYIVSIFKDKESPTQKEVL